MPASRESVDELFARLAASYGSQWLAKWDGMDMDKVASVWQDELGGFKFRHIKYALENLPTDHPPTAMQFRALCKLAPDPAVKFLPEPKADPARVAEVLAPLRQAKRQEVGDKDWAWRMRDREINHGGQLSTGCMMRQYHRDAWRIALKHGRWAEGVIEAWAQ